MATLVPSGPLLNYPESRNIWGKNVLDIEHVQIFSSLTLFSLPFVGTFLYPLTFSELHSKWAYKWPRLWSIGQSSWLQIQRSGFDSRRYHIFREVESLERDPFSLLSTIEELLGRKSRGSGLESREYGHRDPSRWPRGTLYPQKLALISLTSGCRSVCIIRSRTQAMELLYEHINTFGCLWRLSVL
jgi:hypothetical protein